MAKTLRCKGGLDPVAKHRWLPLHALGINCRGMFQMQDCVCYLATRAAGTTSKTLSHRTASLRQVMQWFGRIAEDDTWAMDVEAVVREVGLGILRAYRVCFVPEER